MRTSVKILALSLLALAASRSGANAQGMVLHDLSTGVANGTTTLLAYSSADDTWKARRPGGTTYPNTYVCVNNPAWSTPGCARWITTMLNGNNPNTSVSAGIYEYRTTFHTDYDCYPWIKVYFDQLGADDNVVGFLFNGHSYPLSPATANDFQVLANVVINIDPAHLVLGTNEIIIQVENNSTITGLYVCGNVRAGYCPRPAGAGNTIMADAVVQVRAFPNPSPGRFTVGLSEATEGRVDVMDMMGRKVQEFSLRKDILTYPVDLSAQPKGVYILSVRAGNTTTTQKITLE